MKQIKITKIDGDIFYTRINGTDKDIINHYNDCNFLGADSKEFIQIKEVAIILQGNETGFLGCNERNIVYPFTYNDKAQCYLY